MTKKDYIKFGDMFRKIKDKIEPSHEVTIEEEILGEVIHETAKLFAEDNPKFNMTKFFNYIDNNK